MSQAIIKQQQGGKTPQSDEPILLDLGTMKVDRNDFVKRANEGLQDWLDYYYKNKGDKKWGDFNTVFADVMNQIEQGKVHRNTGGQWEFEEYDPRVEGETPKAVQHVINYLGTIANNSTEYKPQEEKKLKYSDATNLTSIINREYYGGNTPTDLKDWYNQDYDEKTKKYGYTNRVSKLLNYLDEYEQQFLDKDYDFTGTAFNDLNEFKTHLNTLRENLANGNFDDNSRQGLLRLGMSENDIDNYFGSKYVTPSTGISASGSSSSSSNSNSSAINSENSNITEAERLEKEREKRAEEHIQNILNVKLDENNLNYPSLIEGLAAYDLYNPNPLETSNSHTYAPYEEILKYASYGLGDSATPNYRVYQDDDSNFPTIDKNADIYKNKNILKWINRNYDPTHTELTDDIKNQLSQQGILTDENGNYYFLNTDDNSQVMIYDKNSNKIKLDFLVNLPENLKNNFIEIIRNKMLAIPLQNMYKKGGILKNQYGGAFTFDYTTPIVKQEKSKPQPTTNEEVNPVTGEVIKSETKTKKKTPETTKESFSGSDIARLSSILMDIGSLVTSFIPGYGTVASGATGLASSFTNFGADWSEDGLDWGDLGRLGMNIGLDFLGLIPGGKAPKIVKNLTKFVPMLLTVPAITQTPEMIQSIGKIGKEKLTVADWQNVATAIQLAIGGGAAAGRVGKNIVKGKVLNETEIGNKIVLEDGKSSEISRKEMTESLYNPFKRNVYDINGNVIVNKNNTPFKLPFLLGNRAKYFNTDNVVVNFGQYNKGNHKWYTNKVANALENSTAANWTTMKTQNPYIGSGSDYENFKKFLNLGWNKVSRDEAVNAYIKNKQLSKFAGENEKKLAELRKKHGIDYSTSDPMTNFMRENGYVANENKTTKIGLYDFENLSDEFYDALKAGYKKTHGNAEPTGPQLEEYFNSLIKEIKPLRELLTKLYYPKMKDSDILISNLDVLSNTGKLTIDKEIKKWFKDDNRKILIELVTGKEFEKISYEELLKYIPNGKNNSEELLYNAFNKKFPENGTDIDTFVANLEAFKEKNKKYPKSLEELNNFLNKGKELKDKKVILSKESEEMENFYNGENVPININDLAEQFFTEGAIAGSQYKSTKQHFPAPMSINLPKMEDLFDKFIQIYSHSKAMIPTPSNQAKKVQENKIKNIIKSPTTPKVVYEKQYITPSIDFNKIKGYYKKGGKVVKKFQQGGIASNVTFNNYDKFWRNSIYGSDAYNKVLNGITPNNYILYNNLQKDYFNNNLYDVANDPLNYSEKVKTYQKNFNTLAGPINSRFEGYYTKKGNSGDNPEGGYADGFNGFITTNRHLGRDVSDIELQTINSKIPYGITAFIDPITKMVMFKKDEDKNYNSSIEPLSQSEAVQSIINPQIPTKINKEDYPELTNPSNNGFKLSSTQQKEPFNWNQVGRSVIGAMPGVLAELRLLGDIRKNKEIAQKAKDSLVPAYKSPINTHYVVSGDYMGEQLAKTQASDLMNQVSKPMTTDMNNQIAYQNEAHKQGTNYIYGAQQNSDARVRETLQRLQEAKNEEHKYNVGVHDYNTAVGADIIQKKGAIDTQMEASNRASIDARLKQIEKIMRNYIIPNMYKKEYFNLQQAISSDPVLNNLQVSMEQATADNNLVLLNTLKEKYYNTFYQKYGKDLVNTLYHY